MKVLEAIMKGFGIATKNLGLVLILFVFNTVWALGSIPFARQAPAAAPGAVPPPNPAALIFSVVFILISMFMQGGAVGLVRDHLKGGSAALNKFASYGIKYYIRLLAMGIVIMLVVAVAALLAMVIIGATAPLANAAVRAVAIAAAVIIGLAGLYLVILLTMAPYAIVCDEAGVVAAIKKSVGLVTQVFWKVVLLLVLLVLISFGIGFIVGLLAGLVTLAIPRTAGQVVLGVANSAFNSYLGVVMIGAFTAYYLALSKKGEAAPPASPSAMPAA